MINVIIDAINVALATGSAAFDGVVNTGSAALTGLLDTLSTGSFGK
ncbi:hypothetical protein [Nocardia huaxiensis]|uniref:Uncharacterized protein n=1 Tax=Nocardia huaxiensis TaxID=2755382 RepID=A0A7D6VHX5_9NOCA|nr:hypothetical protein [Nocardia huaxiensis]QLY29990.1 hypothetical protein H0264_33110 [Nocardia huaxiensis]UFS96423.1 hypothetical protein LPY97_00290 [Nocardia huaxiensis]